MCLDHSETMALNSSNVTIRQTLRVIFNTFVFGSANQFEWWTIHTTHLCLSLSSKEFLSCLHYYVIDLIGIQRNQEDVPFIPNDRGHIRISQCLSAWVTFSGNYSSHRYANDVVLTDPLNHQFPKSLFLFLRLKV